MEDQHKDSRPEGVYVSNDPYVGTDLYLIERVNGDDSVSKVEVTRDEAETIVIHLARALSRPHGESGPA